MGLDDALTDGQPQARPLALWLGGEEWTEELVHELGGNTLTCFLDPKLTQGRRGERLAAEGKGGGRSYTATSRPRGEGMWSGAKPIKKAFPTASP